MGCGSCVDDGNIPTDIWLLAIASVCILRKSRVGRLIGVLRDDAVSLDRMKNVFWDWVVLPILAFCRQALARRFPNRHSVCPHNQRFPPHSTHL